MLITLMVALTAIAAYLLGSVLSTMSVPVTLLANDFSPRCLILACVAVALIVIKHAENIRRLINHREPKIVFRKDISHKLDNDSF